LKAAAVIQLNAIKMEEDLNEKSGLGTDFLLYVINYDKFFTRSIGNINYISTIIIILNIIHLIS
jgi:hypothetical protein